MSVSFANTFIAKSQKQMPLAEATQNRSFGNYSWTTRLKCDFNRKSFCKFGSEKIEKCEKMIIIFSFLLVGGRGEGHSMYISSPATWLEFMRKRTTVRPRYCFSSSKNLGFYRDLGEGGAESLLPPSPPPAYAPLTWLFYNGSIVIHLLKTL